MLIRNQLSKLTRFGSFIVLAALGCSLVSLSPAKVRAVGIEPLATPTPSRNSALKADGAFGQLPLVFEENQGQTEKGVKFLGRASSYMVLLTDRGATFKLRRENGPAGIVKMDLAGANPTPAITGIDPLAAKTNYYTGSDPNGWRTGVSNFTQVRYQNVYPGIDALFYGAENALEYDFVAAPNADPGAIELHFDGADKLEITAEGDLRITTGDQVLEQRAPVSYQETNGRRALVESHFVLKNSNEVGFAVGAYDHDAPLIIDPAMRYLTYIGGFNGDDSVANVAVDDQQNAYLVGTTGSTDFVTPGAPPRDPDNDGAVFVAKLSPNGAQLLYLTIFDGEEQDSASDIAVDEFGNAYITGQTWSEHFPLHNPYQDRALRCVRALNCLFRDTDAFVVKVNGAGLVANSTYLGGRDGELANGIAVRPDGSLVYITGYTASATFPSVNEYQSGGAFGSTTDAFLTVMPMNGGAPIYSTQFGGNLGESAADVAIDAAGNAYITGDTASNGMPVKAPFQANNNGGTDTFVAKFNPFAAGEASLIYATFLGGAGTDLPHGIAVTAQGRAYITGVTGSFNFPLLNPIDTTNQVNEAYVTAFNANGTLYASTFLGGSGTEIGNAIALDAGEVVYVTGETTSTDFPKSFAFQTTRNGAQDAFVTKLRLGAGTSALISSSYLGGSGSDEGFGIAVFGNKHIYLAGNTHSNDLATSGGAVKPDVIAGSTFGQGFAAHILDTQRDTVGVFDPATTEFLLRNTISPTGQANIISVDFGAAGDIAVTGDWDGDGIDTTGTFTNGIWRYRNKNVFSGYPLAPFTFSFGQSGDIPLVGDWNGDGIETPGVYRPSTQEFLLSDTPGNTGTNPQTTRVVKFGLPGDLPVIGDWDGDGVDTPGTYRPSDGKFRLTDATTGVPAADKTFLLGAAQDLPVSGDWNADGLDDVGLWKPSTHTFTFDTNKTDGTDLPPLVFGAAGDTPLAGEWEGKP
jgi:hypothetical protein